MRNALVWILAAGFVIGSYATEARIISMGRTDNFFMDEQSVFRNPANISIYPNMILGSLGTRLSTGDTNANAALERVNSDPQNPYFGSFVSYSLNQTSDGGSQYPMLSLGAVINRHDSLLDYLDPTTSTFQNLFPNSNVRLLAPLGKIDLILGYALQNGGMIGANGYAAWQRQTSNSGDSVEYETSLYKGNVGVNWPVAKSMDLEMSAGVGLLTAIGQAPVTAGSADSVTVVLAKHDVNFRGDVRLFSALTSLNGDFVPHLGFQYVSLRGGDIGHLNLAGGLGLNINIDKGFFWAGLEGLYDQLDISTDSSVSKIGGRVSFGIERNVVWDWLVVRVGGSKTVLYVNKNAETGVWEQNPEADASDQDMVGIGLGLNVENRLKFDLVVAEDVPYTLTNLFSGPMDHIFTRIDATYSF